MPVHIAFRLSSPGALGFLVLLFTSALQARPAATELYGVVYEARSVPLADVTVELTFGGLHLAQTTALDGKFRFCCLPEGQFQIVFRHPQAPAAGEFALTLSLAQSSHLVAELQPGSAPALGGLVLAEIVRGRPDLAREALDRLKAAAPGTGQSLLAERRIQEHDVERTPREKPGGRCGGA